MQKNLSDMNNSSESIIDETINKIDKVNEPNSDNIKNNLFNYSNSFTDYSSVDCDSLTDSSNKWQQNSFHRNRVFNNYSYERYERNDETERQVLNLSTVNEDLNSFKEDAEKEREYYYQNITRPRAPRPITRRGRDQIDDNSRRNSQNSDYTELIDFSGKNKTQEKLEKYNTREEVIFDLKKKNLKNQVNNNISKHTENLPVINNEQLIIDDDYITLKPPLPQTGIKNQQKSSPLKNIPQSMLNQKNLRLNSRLEERNINSRNTMRTNTSTSIYSRSNSMLHTRKMNQDEIQESVKRLYYVPNRNAQHPKFQTIHSRSLSRQEIDALCARLYLKSSPKCVKQVNKPAIKVLDKIAIDKLIDRLASRGRVPDSCRVIKNSDYKNMGLVQSYAWKGYK